MNVPQSLPVKVPGAGGMFGMILLMSIPVLGLIVSIIFGVSKNPTVRRSLSRAMIMFNIFWTLVIGALVLLFYVVILQYYDISIDFV